jgi:hypothetical protein
MFAYCRISSILNIATLTDSSQVIVVGEVLRVVQVGNGEIPMPDGKPYACESMTAFIRVDEVLKGEIANSTIQVGYLQNSNWEGGPLTNVLREGTYLMFFLKTDGEKFAFTAPEQSSMPMSHSRSALSHSSDRDVYTQVLLHLGEGLFDALKLPESQLRVAAAAALGSVGSNDAKAALFRALDDPDTEVRGRAINSLTGIYHALQCLPTGYAPAGLFEACVEQWKKFATTQNFALTK